MTNFNLKIGQLNVDRRPLYELIIECKNEKFDILLLSDVKINHGIRSNLATVVVSDGRANDAAIFVLNKNLSLGKVVTSECYVMVELKEARFNIGSYYVRPRQKLDKHEYGIQMMKNLIKKRNRWSLLGGDMNAHVKSVGFCRATAFGAHADLAEWIKLNYWSILNGTGVHTCENKYGGGKSTPDWSLATVDMEHRIRWSIEPKFDSFSDHRMICMYVECGSMTGCSTKVVRIGQFLKHITKPNRDTNPENWYQHYTSSIEAASVLRNEKQYRIDIPPRSKELKNKILYLDRLIKRHGVNVEPRFVTQRNELRTKYRFEVKRWKEERFKLHIQSINTENMYKKLTDPIRRYNRSIDHLVVDGTRIVDQTMIIDELLSHHFNYYPPANYDDITSDRAYAPPINSKEIDLAMSSFAPNKAPGMDGVDITMAKKWRERDRDYFDSLFIHWWNECKFPDELKTSNCVILIKNSDKPVTTSNTRLIGLLSIMGKIFERIISYRIAKQLLTDKRLQDNQFGFLPGKSAEAGLKKIHDIRENNKNRIEILAALDIKSAFDKVEHKSLINELNKMDIPRNIIEMLKSYFTERKVRLQIGNVEKTIQVNRGLVQGSKLSPLCFVAAIDRVLRAVEHIKKEHVSRIEIIAYADDLTVIVSHLNDYNSARNALVKLLVTIMDELKELGLTLSPDKIILVTNMKNPLGSIRIHGKNITLADQAKILGVIFSKDFEYVEHMKYIEDKVNNKLNKLKRKMRIGDWMDLTVKKNIATVILFPMITYGSRLWFKDDKKCISYLNRLYKIIMATVLNAYKTSSFASLSMLSGLPPLHIQCLEKEMKTNLKLHNRTIDNIPVEPYTSIIDLPEPWTSPDIIFKGKITRAAESNFDKHELVAYTDGSRALDEASGKYKVGAALIITKNNVVIESRKYKLFHYSSIFEAEALAIFQACQYAVGKELSKIIVVSDALSVIQALTGNKWKSKIILDIVKYIMTKKIQLHLWWCKSHIGIPGNELADKAAKDASDTGILIYRPATISYGTKLIKELLKTRRETEFNNDQFGRTVKQFVSSVFDVTREHMKITGETVKIYTGHGPYMSYFYEIGNATTNSCCCSEVVQDVRHLLFECKYFVKENYEVALKHGLAASEWRRGWEHVVKKKEFHLMIRNRAWYINTSVKKINHMRIIPRAALATHFGTGNVSQLVEDTNPVCSED